MSNTRQLAHELIDRLPEVQLAGLVHFLATILHADDEPVTDEDRRRFHEGQTWFEQRGGKGISMEDVLAEFGLKAEDFPLKP